MIRPSWTLPGILLLGLLLRVWSAASLGVISGDGITRIGIARAFRDGGMQAGLEAARVPGYHPFNPLAVRWASVATDGDLERAGLAVSVLCGTLGILALYLLGRELWGEGPGLLAALCWAALPEGVQSTGDVLTEGQFLLFWILSAWAALRALRDGGLAWAGAAGLLAGLAYETRVEGVGALLALLLALGALAARERAPRRVAQAALVLAGFAAMAAPYVLHLHRTTGRWMLSPQKSLSNLVTAKETVWKAPEEGPSGEVPAPGPLSRYAGMAVDGGEALTPWLLGLAAFALLCRRPWPPGTRFLLLLGVLHLGSLVRLLQTAGYASHRHFLTLAALCCVLAGAGAEALAPRLGSRGRWVGLLLLLGLLAVPACAPQRRDKVFRKETAVWLGTFLEPGIRVAHLSKPWYPYYAGRPSDDWAANPGFYLTHPEYKAAPRVLVLEPGQRDDRSWIGVVAALGGWREVPLPEPHASRIRLFRTE